jgi:predicted SnoaL-like aldol condensation-catalyzing enzyme
MSASHLPLRRTLVAAGVVLSIAACASNRSPLKGSAMNQDRKAQVTALLKAIETGASAPVAVIDPARYVQHNLAVADGLAGFGAALQALPPGSAKVDTVRVFQDGDFVFTHTDYHFFGPKIGFDIFRFENGRIVEHWDNLQVTPPKANPSGRTMTDGPTTAVDLDRTAANKQLVAAFVDDILVQGRMDRLGQYIAGDNYRQHNPQIADGLSGLAAALEAMARAGVTMKYAKVHKVLGEGDFVLTVSEGEFAGKPTSFYDLFRV